MKLYKFYRKYSKDELRNTDDLKVEEKYPLYGFTCHKDIRDKFREIHDMDKFLEFKCEITKEEYAEFANSERGLVIDLFEIKYLRDWDKIAPNEMLTNCIESVFIPCTLYEYELVEDMLNSAYHSPKAVDYHNPLAYKMKYIEALKLLGYIDHWSLLGEYKEPQMDMMVSLGFEPDPVLDDVRSNQLNLFAAEYSDILK